MKTAETKTTATQPARNHQDAGKPFFNKNGEGSFFSENQPSRDYFFSPKTIQPKLTIGKPGDKYEQEADSMAEKVVHQLSNGSSPQAPENGSAASTPTVQTRSIFESNEDASANSIQQKTMGVPIIQAKCSECGKEEKVMKMEDEEASNSDLEVQTKPVFDTPAEPPHNATDNSPAPVVQTKCSACAQEEQLQKMDEEQPEGEEKEVQTKPVFDSEGDPPEEGAVQAKCEDCEAEEKVQKAEAGHQEDIMTKPDSSPKASPSHSLESQLNSSKGGGSALPDSTRVEMEGAFGADFSPVRIHTDSSAVQMNKDLGAQAFAHGSDIYFGAGKYDTGSSSGNELLAHELTHTVQQGASSTTNNIQKFDPENNNGDDQDNENFDDIEIDDREEPFEGAFQLAAREREVESIIGEINVEYATMVVEEDASFDDVFEIKLELSRYKREKYLLQAYAINWFFLEEGYYLNVDTVLTTCENVAMDENDTISHLQYILVSDSIVYEIISDVPELFPIYTIGLYSETITEFERLSDEHLNGFNEALGSITSRPIDDIIPDFVWMHENLGALATRARQISFYNMLDEERSFLLERKDDNSTSLGIDNTRVRINEHIINWQEEVHPELIEELGFLYPALEHWYFYELYKGFASQMNLFKISVETTYERLNEYGSVPDLKVDLDRTYHSSISFGSNRPPSQQSGGVTGAIFHEIYGVLRDKLDEWVEGLEWHEKIKEGFGLYDVLGEIGKNLRQLATPGGIAMMVGFVAFLIGIQFVPFANLVVDAILIALGGIDILTGLVIFGNYFDRSSEANSFISLYRAAKGLKGGGEAILNLLFELIGLAAARAIRGYARYRTTQKLRNIDEIAGHEIIRNGSREVKNAFEEATTSSRNFRGWEDSLNDDTRRFLREHEDTRLIYSEMPPDVRRILTLCASNCIIPGITRSQVSVVTEMLSRLGSGLSPRNFNSLKVLFHIGGDDLGWITRMLRRVENEAQLDGVLLQEFRRRAMEPPGGSPNIVPNVARNTPGSVTGGQNLPHIANGLEWLRPSGGSVALIPGQIAAQLRNRPFQSFDEFRSTFWQAVANDQILRQDFSPENLALMRNGNTPVARAAEQQGGQIRFEIHHVTAIENGGAVYDLNNLAITSPRFHGDIHSGGFGGGDSPFIVQPKAVDTAVTPSHSFESKLSQSNSNGKALSEGTRSDMESGFGTDFKDVRIHADSEATEMNKELGSQAFTNGSDIYFNEGEYDPASTDGQNLLAHELTHTVQQGASVQTKPTIQRSEEEDLAKELEASERDQQAAIDPAPAEQSRQEAEEENLIAQQQTAEQTAEEKGPEGKQAPDKKEAKKGKVAKVKKKMPDKVEPTPTKQEKPKGPAAEFLDQESEKVCDDAAAETQELADNEQAHDEAGEKLQQTEAAVQSPAEENQSRSNAGQVDAVEGMPEPTSDPAETEAEFDRAVEESVPTDIDEMNDFESEGRASVVGNKVLAKTSEQVGAVQGTYNEIENAPAAPPPETAEALPEIETAPETPELNLGEGAVPELAEEHTDFSEYENQSDELMEKEGISQEQLDMVDSGDLAEANKEKKGLKNKVEEEPGKIKTFAQEKQKKVETELKKEEKEGKAEMKAKRKKELANTGQEQVKAKSEMELKKEKVTQHINKIFETAKASVTLKLGNLEKDSLANFDKQQALLSKVFEREVKQDINAWKSKRYSGFWAGVKWLRDKVLGIADFPEVVQAFDNARERYVSRIDLLVIKINNDNNKVIQECKDDLAKAKLDIKEYVDGLGPDLRKTGQTAQKEMKDKLAEMDSFIDKKKEELQQKLCDKKEEAIKAIDEKIEKMKSEMSGLLSLLGNLLLLAAKKFFTWAIESMGGDPQPVLNIIDKGAAVIKAIFTDPIGFFSNLGKAVGGGIDGFVSNIATHLKKGLIGWLTGAMGDSGLQIPEKFDIKGILSLGLQVAGLTWNMIRTKLVKVLGPTGEKMMGMAESGMDVIQQVRAEGPIALWHIIQEKAAEFKEKAMESIKGWLITTIIKKATLKLVTMLNPAGAIVQAIIMLYDAVMFLWKIGNVSWIRKFDLRFGQRDRQRGSGQGGFLHREDLGHDHPDHHFFPRPLYWLSGIGKAIRRIINKIRKPIQKILNKIVKFLAKKVRKLFGKGKKKGEKAGDEKTTSADKKKHKKITAQIKKALDKPPKSKPKTFDAYYNTKKKQALSLEDKYQPLLKKGINLDIKFKPIADDKKDKDIDVIIKIAPNDWTDTIQIETEHAKPYADIIAELTIKAQEERASLKGSAKITIGEERQDKQLSGNVAVAKVSIPGISNHSEYLDIKSATSGGESPIDENEELPPKEDEKLTRRNRKDPKFRERVNQIKFNNPEQAAKMYEDSIKTNETDSERKLYLQLIKDLRAVSSKRGVSEKDLEGKLYLYTERQPCTGCEINTVMFTNIFPKLEVKIFYKFSYNG